MMAMTRNLQVVQTRYPLVSLWEASHCALGESRYLENARPKRLRRKSSVRIPDQPGTNPLAILLQFKFCRRLSNRCHCLGARRLPT